MTSLRKPAKLRQSSAQQAGPGSSGDPSRHPDAHELPAPEMYSLYSYGLLGPTRPCKLRSYRITAPATLLGNTESTGSVVKLWA